MTCQQSLQGFSKIFQQVEPISNLGRLRGPFTCSCCIISSSIPAHQVNFRMRTHPSSGGFFLAIRQEIDCLVALHIYQDGAEFPSTTEREIIYSKLRYVFYGQRWERHDASENRRSARLYPQAIRDTDAQSAASAQTKYLDDLIQTPCHPCPRYARRSQALRKDFSSAG